MSNNRIFNRILPCITVVMAGFWLALLTVSCDRTRNDKGYEYFPDMAHSLAYETYSPNPNFKDGKTEQTPPAGTVNRELIPYPFAASDSGRAMAGKILTNPFQPTTENIKYGKSKYVTYCQNCHGEKGDGQGYLFVSKRFTVPPASYLSDRVMKLPQGELFHVITRGYNAMGPHGSFIPANDRWRIILYIQKELQHKL